MNDAKWYADAGTDESPIISSRIRLARNIKKYPFGIKLDDANAKAMVQEAVSTILNDRTHLSEFFTFVDLTEKTANEARAMLERHIISTELMESQKYRGLLLQADESVNIMLNEEDHIRIQSIRPGADIAGALENANRIDDLMEETVEFAFDKEFGYLTSCPTNAGTGMRSSFMVHLPLLEKTEQLRNLLQALGKFGMTVRGLYGEGTESQGSIYQISNQITLGKNEEEIISGLENVTKQIVEKEQYLWEKAKSMETMELPDTVYRSFGILCNCRRLSLKEAMHLLSNVRIGYGTGILQAARPGMTIYQIMMAVQPGNLQMHLRKELPEKELEIQRAEYIRGIFGPLNMN